MSRPLPEPLRHVHFVAIGGTGMGSLAGLLHARGMRVTGSDRALYPPMSEALEAWKIPVALGFAPEHVLDPRPDLVVIGNAVRADNPEARAALDAGLCVRSFPDALYELAIAGKHSVVVAGTHGKTTTTSLVATILLETGRDPSLLVGGLGANFDGPFRDGGGSHFVVEGDEYDTVFFDKTPKFLHYHPRTLLLTSLEFDHADIYRDLEHVKEAFRMLLRGLPRDGVVVAAERETLRDVCREAPCRVEWYGVARRDRAPLQSPPLSWWADAVVPDHRGTRFRLSPPSGEPLSVAMPLHGDYNVENAVGALATCAALGVPVADGAAALRRFRGVRRRQELRGEIGGVAVVDDFAHHPTAVRETIAALRDRFPGRRLLAAFEPRSNTSRRALFQEAYVDALAGADQVAIPRVAAAPLYSATGAVTEFFDADAVADALRARGLEAQVCADPAEVTAFLLDAAQPGDVLLVMSNGDFGGLCEMLLKGLRA